MSCGEALASPQRQQSAPFDAKILFDAREQCSVLLKRDPAVNDAPVGNPTVDVLPSLLLEFRLLAHLRENAHVGLKVTHHARVRVARDTGGDGAGAKSVPPLS